MFQATFIHGRPLMIDYTPTADVAAGTVVLIGGRVCISHTDIPANTLGALSIGDGSYSIAKDTSTFAVGDAWYWDDVAKKATSTSGGNTFGGFCELAAATGATVVSAILFAAPATLTIRGGGANPITDPGNAGAIPVTASGYVALVTGAADTRTLAAPTFVGQRLSIYVKTDGGTCVITSAVAINQAGNNTLTMADLRDFIELVCIESGATKVWQVVANDGTALSTV